MQVKLCPKCGLENKPDKSSCAGCYVSLEDVAPTEAKEKPAPVKTQPAVEQPPAAQPVSPSGPSETPATGYATPSGAPSYSYGPASERQSTPFKRGPNWGAIVFVILLLGGAGFAGWWFFLKPASPEAVVQKYVNASIAGDYDAFKSCLCRDQVAVMEKVPGGEQAARDMMKQGAKQAAGRDMGFEIVKTTYENSGSLAVVEIKPKDQSNMPPGQTTMETLLVQEDGKWKIDMKATVMRMMKKAFPNGMPGMPK